MTEGDAFNREIARWASSTQWATNGGRCPPAIRRRNGSLIETWEDLKSLGFEVRVCTCHILFELVSVSLSTQMEVLHSSSFAYNCRVMETRLHREFKESVNRLWSHIGAGSYYLSEKAIQVHDRDICHLFVLTHDAESARPRVDQQGVHRVCAAERGGYFVLSRFLAHACDIPFSRHHGVPRRRPSTRILVFVVALPTLSSIPIDLLHTDRIKPRNENRIMLSNEQQWRS
jgi:hypothetical protein